MKRKNKMNVNSNAGTNCVNTKHINNLNTTNPTSHFSPFTSKNAITLNSLIIYMIVSLVIIGILTTVTTNFRKNMKNLNVESSNMVEFDKFNTYFLEEIKKTANSISSMSNSQITFTSGNKYQYEEGTIYLIKTNEKIAIANKVTNCIFGSYKENGKTIVTVQLQIGETERTKEYVMNNLD